MHHPGNTTAEFFRVSRRTGSLLCAQEFCSLVAVWKEPVFKIYIAKAPPSGAITEDLGFCIDGVTTYHVLESGQVKGWTPVGIGKHILSLV